MSFRKIPSMNDRLNSFSYLRNLGKHIVYCFIFPIFCHFWRFESWRSWTHPILNCASGNFLYVISDAIASSFILRRSASLRGVSSVCDGLARYPKVPRASPQSATLMKQDLSVSLFFKNRWSALKRTFPLSLLRIRWRLFLTVLQKNFFPASFLECLNEQYYSVLGSEPTAFFYTSFSVSTFSGSLLFFLTSEAPLWLFWAQCFDFVFFLSFFTLLGGQIVVSDSVVYRRFDLCFILVVLALVTLLLLSAGEHHNVCSSSGTKAVCRRDVPFWPFWYARALNVGYDNAGNANSSAPVSPEALPSCKSAVRLLNVTRIIDSFCLFTDDLQFSVTHRDGHKLDLAVSRIYWRPITPPGA